MKFCHSADEEYVTNAKLEVIPAITSRDYQAKLKILTSWMEAGQMNVERDNWILCWSEVLALLRAAPQ